MDKVIIKTKTKDLLQILKMVKGAIRGKSARALSAILEITVTDGKATFAVPGAIFTLECITQGTCKATVPFNHFIQIVKDLIIDEIEFIITTGNMKIHNITISAKTTFFENDRILRTIHLPINYTDFDILNLTNEGYTWEELEFNKLIPQIKLAEKNLEDNLNVAYKKLKTYGVKYEDLKKMVDDKFYQKVKKKEANLESKSSQMPKEETMEEKRMRALQLLKKRSAQYNQKIIDKKLKKLYLDVDGVLLTNKDTKAAPDAIEFLYFILDNFECFWLTTHCKGDINSVLNYLKKYFDTVFIAELLIIRTTNWTTLKTEAIDLTSDFIWLEDYPLEAEIEVLNTHSKSDNLIIVNLNNPNELKRVMAILKERLK